MATTSLWRVHGFLGKVVVYVEDPDKTDNPKFFERPDLTEHQRQGLTDVIEYAVNEQKTTKVMADESEVVMQQFVSGVNICPAIARDTMLRTQREFQKTGGVVAYHGYQAFAPGEATPEIAHEIGRKLARQLWGDRYQVLVATHLDHGNHLHNHFIINTVSHVDGKKFYRSERDYYAMQKASDALCRAYGLSVIEKPKRGKAQHRAEWQDGKSGKPTYRNTIKADIDAAIRQAMTERQFWDALKKMGYDIKMGEDITVRPQGKDRGLKLRRNFGDEYSIERIRHRIYANEAPEPPPRPPRGTSPMQQARVKGSVRTAKKCTGLRARYFYYYYRMGGGRCGKPRQQSAKQVHFLYREDLRYMRNVFEEARLLAAHKIDTDAQLAAHTDSIGAQMAALIAERARLRKQARGMADEPCRIEVSAKANALTERIGKLRKEVKLCEDIAARSGVMVEKIRRARQNEKPKSSRKERTKHEPFR